MISIKKSFICYDNRYFMQSRKSIYISNPLQSHFMNKTYILKSNSNGQSKQTSDRVNKVTLTRLLNLCTAGHSITEILEKILDLLDRPENSHLKHALLYSDDIQKDPQYYPKLLGELKRG